ncbi:exopolysaccharide Pel transporter PelG [Fodinibius saliphilus]|uniref:exopolysaccharide Pel transporter PelG n=1 Tax=Fodinibius saliphilus TaxID=1920650 RepID=UPI00110893D9|nr:exopolysaccharide Pel transporter PelG [Fodinibius saliphilus]
MSELPVIESKTIDSVEELTEEVRELVGNPLSRRAVAATIESLGVREVDVKKDFGYDSIFDLADDLYVQLKKETRKREEANSGEQIAEITNTGFLEQVKFFCFYYGKGLLFSLPMLSQIAAVIIFRYSLWAWLEFNEAQATVVAFGTITAFVITGGFIQVMGRSVTTHKSNNNFNLAFKAAKQIVSAGVSTVLLLALLFFMVNLVIPFYPQPMIVLGLVYMVLISFLLLGSGVLYALQQQIPILVIIAAGTFVVLFNMEVMNMGIYVSQWLAMAITTGTLYGYAYLFFKLKIRFGPSENIEQSLAEPEVRYYINYRYFIYGFGYFLFLFLDRILAWSAGPPPPPYIIWFNTPYELGMDWALLTLVLSVAVLEYSVEAFSKFLVPLQKKAKFSELESFNKYYKRFYFRQIILLLLVSAISIALTYYSVISLKSFGNEIPEIRDFFANPMTTKVFWIASISYVFLNIGLLHTLFFFTLHKPKYSMCSILAAVVVNIFVGYLCSRIIALEYAVFGLLGGSICFAIISGLIAKRFFQNLDYYYYSAF